MWAYSTEINTAWLSVDVHEVVHQLGLQVTCKKDIKISFKVCVLRKMRIFTIDAVSLISLVHIVDLHPAKLPKGQSGEKDDNP